MKLVPLHEKRFGILIIRHPGRITAPHIWEFDEELASLNSSISDADPSRRVISRSWHVTSHDLPCPFCDLPPQATSKKVVFLAFPGS